MRERLHLTFHAKNETIPLRLGRLLLTEKIYIDNVVDDPIGTGNQTFSQRSNGNVHLVVDLWTESSGGECIGRWRAVVGQGNKPYHDRSLITLLQQADSEIKSENSLTDKLHKSIPNNSWITPEYIINHWHPLYKAGKLKNSEDLSILINEVNFAPVKQELNDLRDANEKQESYIMQLEEALQMNKLAEATLNKEMMGPARKVTNEWASKTGSKYVNYGIDAYISGVSNAGDKIYLSFIDELGQTVTVDDFGYNGFVEPVYKYLLSKKDSRAVFILTYQPGKSLKLASDTMLLPAYRGLWA